MVDNPIIQERQERRHKDEPNIVYVETKKPFPWMEDELEEEEI